MGDPSDHGLIGRFRSWTRTHASDRNRGGDKNSHASNNAKSAPAAENRENVTNASSRTFSRRAVHDEEKATRNNVADHTSDDSPPPAPPPLDGAGDGDASASVEQEPKPKITTRMKSGSYRFYDHTKDAILGSWVNVLLVFVPAGIVVKAININPAVVFALNAVAIIPLAGLLTHATESVARRLGDTWGALLNVSFGNAVELIIFVIALAENQITIVQASILGSILANLLLILGMAFLVGGLRFQEQIYNSTVTQMSACLLSLSVTSLLLPTAFRVSFSNDAEANTNVLKISRGTSVVLLLVYILYLLFQLKSHAYMYESTPQRIIDEESHPGVLAEAFESSSFSDTSSSDSDSDTDASSDSNTTAKRIMRTFRRHRKASVSSDHVSSLPSIMSIPSAERDRNVSTSQVHSAVGSTYGDVAHSHLPGIMSGDEADGEEERRRQGSLTRVRDFGNEHEDTGESVKSFEHRRKKRRLRRKSKKHRRKTEAEPKPEQAAEQTQAQAPEPNPELEMAAEQAPSTPHVGFADEEPERQVTPNSRRAFALQQLSRGGSFRPALPKVLSSTVFTNPPPGGGPQIMPVESFRMRPSALRRTNSLPDRLNRNTSGTQAVPPASVPPAQQTAPGTVEVDKKEDGEDPEMSRTSAIVMLLLSTALVAVCAEFLVDAIPAMTGSANGSGTSISTVSVAFIGLIILPIVGNAAEHVTAVTVAAKNKMDLAIGVAVGSSIQIALFVTPIIVLLGWILDKNMSLEFNLFETVSLFVTAFIVNFLVLDGRSNYLEGSLLIAAYVIIAVAAFFYPNSANQSPLNGTTNQNPLNGT